jgi:hypothetical protein
MDQRSKAAAARLARGPPVAVVRCPSRAPTISCTVSAEPRCHCRTWPRPHATKTKHAYHAGAEQQYKTARSARRRALGWRGGRMKKRRAGLRQGDPHLCPGRPGGRRFRRPPSSQPSSLVRLPGRVERQPGRRALTCPACRYRGRWPLAVGRGHSPRFARDPHCAAFRRVDLTPPNLWLARTRKETVGALPL